LLFAFILGVSLLWNWPFIYGKFTQSAAASAVKPKAVMLHVSERIFKANQASNGNDEYRCDVFPERFATYRYIYRHRIPMVRGKGVFQGNGEGLIEDRYHNFPQSEHHLSWVNNLERQFQVSFYRIVRKMGTFDVNILNINPLPHASFLQPDGLHSSLGSMASFSRLPANESSSQGRDNNQPPVGPLEECVPVWRACLGCFCLLCGFLVIAKGDGFPSVICGLALVLGGTFIWLGKKVACENTYSGSNDIRFHGANNVSQKYLTTLYFCNTLIHMANALNFDKQIAVIGALAEGSSIRSIERITGVHRDTVMRLGVRVGKGCAALMDAKMRDLGCRYLEFDEIWGFIGKKEKNLTVDDGPECGDAWTFCAVDAETKLVPAFKVGKRDGATANAFVQDVANRMKNRVQISTDGLRAYVEAIEKAFGKDVDYAQIVKTYIHDESGHPNRRYSAPDICSTEKKWFAGRPDMRHVSTSYVERLNATTRLHMRRLTRLTLAFSKKRENFEAAVALHFAYYNFVKRHNTLRCTPAMAAGVERDFLTVGDLVEATV
jgi:IS1 family transposase